MAYTNSTFLRSVFFIFSLAAIANAGTACTRYGGKENALSLFATGEYNPGNSWLSLQSGSTPHVQEDGSTASFAIITDLPQGHAATVHCTTEGQIYLNGLTELDYAIPGGCIAGSCPENPYTVTIQAIDDSDQEGPQNSVIHCSAETATGFKAGPSSLALTIDDNDIPGILITPSGGGTSLTEGGLTDSYTIELLGVPNTDVTIVMTFNSDRLKVNNSSAGSTQITIPAASYRTPQTITVQAVNNDIADGNVIAPISHTVSGGVYDGLIASDASVEVTDNDTAGIAVSETGGATGVAEGGSDDTVAIQLNSQPTGPVTITLATDVAQLNLNGTPGTTTLTFDATNWNTLQTITVNAIDDALSEGQMSRMMTVSATGADYEGLTGTPVTVAIADNETPGFSITETSGNTTVTEGVALGDVVAIRLTTKPISNVIVSIDFDPSQITINNDTSGHLERTFTPSNYAANFGMTVRPVDDSLNEGSHSATVTFSAQGSGYDTVTGQVTVNIVDNEIPGFTVLTPNGTDVTEGSSNLVQVQLTGMPTADVTAQVSVVAGEISFDGTTTATATSTTILQSSWSIKRGISISALPNFVVGDARSVTLRFTLSSTDARFTALPPIDVVVNILDGTTPNTVWWSSDYAHRLNLKVATNNPAYTAGQPMYLVFDTTVGSSGVLSTNGDDVRLVYQPNVGPAVELNRVANQWNGSSQINYDLPCSVPANSGVLPDGNLYLYYGNASPPIPMDTLTITSPRQFTINGALQARP